MDLGTSPEAASWAATQKPPSILWNRSYNNLTMVPILSQTNPSYLSNIHHDIIHGHMFWSSCGLFTSVNLYMFLFSPFMLHDLPISPSFTCNYVWQRVQIMQFLIMQLSPTYCHIIPFGPNILPSTLFSNTLSLCYFNIRDKVSHPYRTKDKIIALHILILKFLDSR
jgi:hypothetical protein